jgi:uncharacterized membrane protein
MQKERLLAYTDAVVAIIITIMVLEFKTPHEASRHALREMRHIVLWYILSFIYLSIYRNNHHHSFQPIEKINGTILWSNNVLLFFMSLVPFLTWWMSETHFAQQSVIAYWVVLLACALSYFNLQNHLMCLHGKESVLAKAIAKDYKWYTSLILYIIWIIWSFFTPAIWLTSYTIVALMWLIPDKRIEKALAQYEKWN